MVGKLT